MTAPADIRIECLEHWCVENVPDCRTPLRVTLIAGGHSNLTYRIDGANGRSLALRRPPLGELPRSAHDVLREYRILAALKATAFPVPRVEAACADTAVLGAPFYVMSWVDGTILDRASALEAILPAVEQRQQVAFNLIDVLADLHTLDIDAVGLGQLGARQDYLSRQLHRLRRVWDTTKTRELPLIESLYERLLAAQPVQRYTGLVHADYRMGNVILAAGGRIAAVLDWELCALGDVLTDLGFLLVNWDEPGDFWPNVWMEVPPTRAGGFPSRDDMISRYAKRTGFDVADIDYYRAFCYWRIAVIAEGIKRRYEAGAMSTQMTDAAALDKRVRDRAALAEHFLTLARG